MHKLRSLRGLLVSFAVSAVVFGQAGSAAAAGYALLEQSAQGTGLAFAGATAGYEDGSAVFYNPAAMSTYKKSVFNLGGSFIIPQAKFHNEGSHTSPTLGGKLLLGDNGPDGGKTALVPNFYLTAPVTDDLSLGFAVNSPFGLATEYSRTWVGRYSAVTSDLRTVSMSPAASYKLTDDFSIGAAVNVTYVSAELSNMVDFGTIGVAALGLPMASRMGLLPQAADGFAKVTGDDWAVGATVGASYTYCDGSKVGISYRSPVRATLTGDAEFDIPSNARVLTQTGAFTDTSAKADLTLPDSISVGWIHEIDDEWKFLADTQWTNWSRFKDLRVEYGSTQPDTVVDEGWDNVWRFSVGTEYKATNDLTLRSGFTYDEEPISDAQHRTPRIPGNDRYWLSVGLSYSIYEDLRFDFGYAHLFVADASTDITGSTGETLNGNWDSSIDIFSAQIVWDL